MTTTFAPSAGQEAPGAGDLTNASHFEQFILAYSSIVFTVCLRLLRDRVAAEDAVQETFVAAWRHRSQLRPNRAWLVKVATNKCLDELRSRSRIREHCLDDPEQHACLDLPATEPSPETRALGAEAQSVLQRALSELPRDQSTAVVLSDVEGWTYREIADRCGISIGTVKSRISRGRRSLRETLAASWLTERPQ